MNRKIADPGQELCVCMCCFLGWYSRESRLDGHTHLLSAGRGRSALLGLYKLCSLASEPGTCQKLQVSHKLQILPLADRTSVSIWSKINKLTFLLVLEGSQVSRLEWNTGFCSVLSTGTACRLHLWITHPCSSAVGECVLMFCTSLMKLLCSHIQTQHTAAALISCSGTWADSFRVWFQCAGLAGHSRFASPALGMSLSCKSQPTTSCMSGMSLASVIAVEFIEQSCCLCAFRPAQGIETKPVEWQSRNSQINSNPGSFSKNCSTLSFHS